MLGRLAIAAGVATLAGGSACAMTMPEANRAGCHVTGAELLPSGTGGADALCKAVANAAAKQAPGVEYTIEIRVLPRSRLSALVTMSDGSKLQEQNFVRMDKPLSSGAFERFASAVALELAKAASAKSAPDQDGKQS